MNDGLKELHDRLLNIMVEVDKICRQNNLKYTLMGGSLIGAIRHNGFIPWDDDLDIGLLLSDYLKLIEVLKQLEHPWLTFDIPGNDDYEQQFIKVYDSRTTLKEIGNNRFKGVFIDVFPIINIGNNLLFSKIRYYKGMILKLARYNQTNNSHPTFFKNIVYKFVGFFYNPAKLTMKIQNYRIAVNHKYNKYVSDPDGSVKGIVPAKIFDSYIEHKFESCEFMIIENYHTYLSMIFGDYMKLPPIENRVSGHFDILDLNKSYLDK